MKHSIPISLFSFQDIITTLTGIMIVIVLVIMLQLVESTVAVIEQAERRPEYVAMKKKETELLEEKKVLLEKIKNGEAEKNDFSDISLPELQAMLEREKLTGKYLAMQIERTNEALQKIIAENQNLERLEKEIKAKLKEISKEEHLVQEFQTQLLALQKRKEQISQMIETKKKTLRFEFVGTQTRTPFLVECNKWGIRVKKYPDGEVKQFGNPGNDILRRGLSDFVTWLQKEDLNRSYLVLLFREDAIVFHNEIILELQKMFPALPFGKEPLGKMEDCFL